MDCALSQQEGRVDQIPRPEIADQSTLEEKPKCSRPQQLDDRSRTAFPEWAEPNGQLRHGAFLGTKVPLGDVRTDKQGHLLVLGGFGRSSSPTHVPIDESEFANND